MSLTSFALKSLGSLIRVVSDQLTTKPPSRTESANGEVQPVDFEPPAKPRRAYDQKEHLTYYLAGATLLPLLLDNPGPKTVKDLVGLSSETIPQSTIRGVCKGLAKEGILERVAEYPAAFIIPESGKEQALQFIEMHKHLIA